MVVVIAVIAAGAGAYALYFGFNRMHRYRVIQDTPTSKIRSMAMGLVEICGKAAADTYIKAHFSGIDCVYYRYEVKEYRRHRSGKNTSYRWETIDRGEKRMPFFACDDSGRVLVRPAGAEFHVPVDKVFLRRAGVLGPLILSVFGSDSAGQRGQLVEIDPNATSWFSSVGDRKYYEYYIAPEESIYVLGTADIDRMAPDSVVLRKGDNEPTFIISDRSERCIVSNLWWQMFGSFAAAFVLIAAAVFVFSRFL